MGITTKFRGLGPRIATFLLNGAAEIRNLGKHLFSLISSSLVLSSSHFKIAIAWKI